MVHINSILDPFGLQAEFLPVKAAPAGIISVHEWIPCMAENQHCSPIVGSREVTNCSTSNAGLSYKCVSLITFGCSHITSFAQVVLQKWRSVYLNYLWQYPGVLLCQSIYHLQGILKAALHSYLSKTPRELLSCSSRYHLTWYRIRYPGPGHFQKVSTVPLLIWMKMHM